MSVNRHSKGTRDGKGGQFAPNQPADPPQVAASVRLATTNGEAVGQDPQQTLPRWPEDAIGHHEIPTQPAPEDCTWAALRAAREMYADTRRRRASNEVSQSALIFYMGHLLGVRDGLLAKMPDEDPFAIEIRRLRASAAVAARTGDPQSSMDDIYDEEQAWAEAEQSNAFSEI